LEDLKNYAFYLRASKKQDIKEGRDVAGSRQFCEQGDMVALSINLARLDVCEDFQDLKEALKKALMIDIINLRNMVGDAFLLFGLHFLFQLLFCFCHFFLRILLFNLLCFRIIRLVEEVSATTEQLDC